MVKLWHFVSAAHEMRREDEGHDYAQVCHNHKREMGVCRRYGDRVLLGNEQLCAIGCGRREPPVAAYTAAVDLLDPAKMEALWVHDDTVMDIEPGSRTIAVGWDAVKKFIDGNFLVFAELKNVLADGPYVQIKGDLARSMGIAMVTYKLKNGTAARANVFLTHVFEKRDGAWLLVCNSSRRFRSRRLTPPNQRGAREVRGRFAPRT